MSKKVRGAGLPTLPPKWSTVVEDQVIDLQCAYNDHGVRCERYGTLSPSTNGKGPWYCRKHYGPGGVRVYDDPDLHQSEPAPVDIPAATPPYLRWAYRIRERWLAHDPTLPSISVEKARAALGSAWERQSGEDG